MVAEPAAQNVIFAALDENREKVRVLMERLKALAGPIDMTMAVVRRAYAVDAKSAAFIHRQILELNRENEGLTAQLCE